MIFRRLRCHWRRSGESKVQGKTKEKDETMMHYTADVKIPFGLWGCIYVHRLKRSHIIIQKEEGKTAGRREPKSDFNFFVLFCFEK